MHYIVGTQIQVNERSVGKIRPGMTGAQIRAASNRSSLYTEQKSKLKPGTIYALTRIYKSGENYVYKFIGSGDIQELQFKTITEAESFISETRGESLPDYSSVYNNMTD